MTILGQAWGYLLFNHPLDINPPAWTLGVEISFYLLAPFILRRPAVVISLFALSILARVLALQPGAVWHPAMDYRFFPFELATFLFGALSHRYLYPIARWLVERSKNQLDIAMTGVAVTTLAVGMIVQEHDLAGYLGLYVRYGSALVFGCAVPFLFIFQNRFRADTVIGELSYPIYVSHRFAILAVHIYLSFNYPSLLNKELELYLILGCTILLAIALNQFVARPIEPLRHRAGRYAAAARARPIVGAVSEPLLLR